MVNSYKASKDYYGGETMPEGMKDCNSCGWYGKEENFKYGLCISCAPWDEDEDNFDYEAYDKSEREYQDYLEMEAWYEDNKQFLGDSDE